MKTIVLLFVIFSLAYADPATASTGSGSTETGSKSETKSPNSLPTNTGPNSISPAKNPYYSTRASVPTYVQFVQKPVFTPPHSGSVPQTTFIIAQPALLPHSVVYGHQPSHQAQQLLNYFHSNPSAKYQLLYNYQPQVQPHQAQSIHGHGQSQSQGHGHGQTVYVAATPHPAYHNIQFVTPQTQYYYVQPQQTHTSGSYQSQQYQLPQSYTHLPQYQFSSGHGAEVQSQRPKVEALQSTRLQSHTHGHSHSQGKSQGHQTPFVPSAQLSPSLAHSLHQVSSQLSSQHQTQHQSQPTQSQPQYTTQYYNQAPQTFTAQPPTHKSQIKSVAPIITGLENFSPEQQAQIKEQLSSHFGSLTQINSNSLQANPEYQTKFRIEVQAPETEYTSVSTQPSQATESNLKQESREDQSHEDHHQHLHQHYLSQRHEPQSYSGPVFSYRTPQYTKG